MITEINKAWNWKGFNATEIIRTNDFGNVIFKTDKNEYWRICPEEVTCKMIAENQVEFDKLLNDSEFIEDWKMTNIINTAKSVVGELKLNEKYCLKMPALIGGQYDKSNYGKVPFAELISFSGDLAKQIENLKDGQKIKFVFK
ncbi:T6SS immunity protein Tdi1 domain-containing protein [Winogradskyella tangerina]|uniref:T6SS immunity protein Tdi1 domain-containing protein n=1 Tax=Winogradskyella tangerina TaxID=2023240 RepID=UPI000DBE06B3|nr:T6SS immunity protein Tdi1 domain-containing protein [Winogradskyella tangerina]